MGFVEVSKVLSLLFFQFFSLLFTLTLELLRILSNVVLDVFRELGNFGGNFIIFDSLKLN